MWIIESVELSKDVSKKISEFKKEGKTIILVSHALDMVRKFCSRVLLLDGGKVKGEGDPEKVVPLYRELLLTKGEEQKQKKSAASPTKKPKVLVLGLDGATFELILPWVKRGKLKNFAKILKAGSYCNLRSSLPPVTAPAWASFLTGKNPGKHGVFDFREYHPGSYDGPVVNSKSIHSETLLELISRNGGKVGAINVPLTYPPMPVNGFVVSGLPAPTRGEDFTYPANLIQEIKLMGINYKLDLDWMYYKNKQKGKAFLQDLRILTEQRKKVTLELMNKHSWDFFITVFTGIDQTQHYYWRYMDRTHPNYESGEPKTHRNAILDSYKEMDAILEEVMDRMDEETILILVSDHGSGPLKKKINFHHWLVNHDLMRLKTKVVREARYDFIQRFSEATVNTSHRNSVAPRQLCIARDGRDVLFAHPPSEINYEISLPKSSSLNFAIALDPRVWSPEKGEGVSFEIYLARESGGSEKIFSQYIDPKNNLEDRRWHDYEIDLSQFEGEDVHISFITRPGDSKNTSFCWAAWGEPRICNSPLNREERTYGIIDWPNTRVFFGSTHNIFVNLRGREKDGLIKPGVEYENVVKETIKRLSSLENAETKERIIQKIYRKKDIYWGRYFDLAPDLVILATDNTYQGKFPCDPVPEIIQPLVPEEDWGGLCASHRMNGIFIAYGKNINKEYKLPDKDIVDVAPTILYALGLPIPKDIDGKVITDIFEKSFFSKNKIILEDSTERKRDDLEQANIFSDEETEKTKEKLRALGYIS